MGTNHLDPWCCLLATYLVLVPDRIMGIPQFPPASSPPPSQASSASSIHPREPSTSVAPGSSTPSANFTSSSLGEPRNLTTSSLGEPRNITTSLLSEPQNHTASPSGKPQNFTSSSGAPWNLTASPLGEPRNLTGATDPQQELQLPSPRGQQPFNGGEPPPTGPRRSNPVTRPSAQKGTEKFRSPLRRCCPYGHVTRETGECVSAAGPVLNLTRLVGTKACGEDLSLVYPVTCSPEEQEVRVSNITSSTLVCGRGIAIVRNGKEWLSDFCVGVGEDGRDKALFCKLKPNPELCHNLGQVHVNKCCPCGQVLGKFDCARYKASTNTSANNEKPWGDPFQKWASEKGFSVRHHKPRCPHGSFYLDKFHFESDGHLYIHTRVIIDDDAFCLDYDVSENKLVADVCIEIPTVWQRFRFKILPVGLFVSVLLLSLTLFFHFSVPELRRSEHLSLISYMVTLLASDVLLLTVQVFAQLLPQRLCHALGYFILFFAISTFCWLTVICTDILLQARICNNFKKLVERLYSTNKKNLIIYSSFAYGFPLVMCIIAVAMDFCCLENTSLIRPNFGKTTCVFELHDKRGRMFYYDLPLAVLFVVSLVQLAAAFQKISQIRKINQNQGTTNSRHPKEKRISVIRDFLRSLLDRCQRKIPTDNSGKQEAEDKSSQAETECDMTKDGPIKSDFSAYREGTRVEESSFCEEKSSNMESAEIQSMVTLSSSVESLPNLDLDSRNDPVLASSNDVPLKNEESTKPPDEKCDSQTDDHKQKQLTRRQTGSGLRKFAKNDFISGFWHRVFIFTLMMVCWTTEVASGFIKPLEMWAFTDVLNTLQGSFQFFLLLRNRCKRNLCKLRYPAFFAAIDAVESAVTQCFSYLKSLLCQMCKACFPG